MKTIVNLFALLICSLFAYQAVAQSSVPDQNPNYRVSLEKYMMKKDSLLSFEGTTVQDTYKAFDWYEAKQERKEQRRLFRHQERMERAKYSQYYTPYYNNYWGGYNNWGWFPSIGFRTGNWWFSI